MASFDPYTKRILLEVVAGVNSNPSSVSSITGAVAGPQNTGLQSKKRNKKFGKGRATYGTGAPQVKGEVAPLKATPEQIWFGTHDEMPAGSDLPTQAMWGRHKKFVNDYLAGVTAGTLYSIAGVGADLIKKGADKTALGPLYDRFGKPIVDYVMGKGSGIATLANPQIEFVAKQAVRTAFAQQYLGGSPSKFDSYGPAGSLANALYSGANLVLPLPDQQVKSSKKNEKYGRFGKIGDLVAEKLPQIAAMGIDPLDWSTQMFGADEALAAYQGAAASPGRAAMGAMGYLSRGLQKGVYR